MLILMVLWMGAPAPGVPGTFQPFYALDTNRVIGLPGAPTK